MSATNARLLFPFASSWKEVISLDMHPPKHPILTPYVTYDSQGGGIKIREKDLKSIALITGSRQIYGTWSKNIFSLNYFDSSDKIASLTFAAVPI